MLRTVQTHSRILPDPWHNVGPGLCFLSPTDAAVIFKNRASPAPHSPNFLQRSSLMAAREVQSLSPSPAINNI